MGAYQIDAFVHLFASVLTTGYMLFWAIMACALGRRFDADRTERLLETVRESRWPHVLVPWSLRLTFPMVGWVFLAVMAISGGFAGTLGESNVTGGIGGLLTPLLILKLLLFVLLVLGHALVARRPRPVVTYANLALTLAIVAISANLLR